MKLTFQTSRLAPLHRQCLCQDSKLESDQPRMSPMGPHEWHADIHTAHQAQCVVCCLEVSLSPQGLSLAQNLPLTHTQTCRFPNALAPRGLSLGIMWDTSGGLKTRLTNWPSSGDFFGPARVHLLVWTEHFCGWGAKWRRHASHVVTVVYTRLDLKETMMHFYSPSCCKWRCVSGSVKILSESTYERVCQSLKGNSILPLAWVYSF